VRARGCSKIVFKLGVHFGEFDPAQIYAIERCNFEELEKLYKEILGKVWLIRFLEELNDLFKKGGEL
jgi:hypothetical protein